MGGFRPRESAPLGPRPQASLDSKQPASATGSLDLEDSSSSRPRITPVARSV